MSRDPERIDRVLDAVRTAWKAAPDLRLTQLLTNTTGCETSAEFYNVEDDVLEQWFRCLHRGQDPGPASTLPRS